ncbi:hypothetical protein BD289DRAFT_13136 [Coniella lustricola]|uniref:Uncharacterized protein n=1 Tax=Coniella lustricola TaxID=2025994 RepID=A0A2T3A471_9PEZI|nr:hypothetical protein BD289DRAFT_13136 [Coniella lustricola]
MPITTRSRAPLVPIAAQWALQIYLTFPEIHRAVGTDSFIAVLVLTRDVHSSRARPSGWRHHTALATSGKQYNPPSSSLDATFESRCQLQVGNLPLWAVLCKMTHPPSAPSPLLALPLDVPAGPSTQTRACGGICLRGVDTHVDAGSQPPVARQPKDPEPKQTKQFLNRNQS